nr:hypothetical protein BaRGS_025335 [Batillaria attramentaria]
MKNDIRAILSDQCPYYYRQPPSQLYKGIWFYFYITLMVLSTVSLFLQTLLSFRVPLSMGELLSSGIYDNVTGHCFLPLWRG